MVWGHSGARFPLSNLLSLVLQLLLATITAIREYLLPVGFCDLIVRFSRSGQKQKAWQGHGHH